MTRRTGWWIRVFWMEWSLCLEFALQCLCTCPIVLECALNRKKYEIKIARCVCELRRLITLIDQMVIGFGGKCNLFFYYEKSANYLSQNPQSRWWDGRIWAWDWRAKCESALINKLESKSGVINAINTAVLSLLEDEYIKTSKLYFTKGKF